MPKQRVGLRRELAGAPRTREGFSRTFLLRFICEKHTLSFRYAELDALLAAHGVDPRAAYAAPAGGEGMLWRAYNQPEPARRTK